MKHTDAFDVPLRYIDDDVRDRLDDNIEHYVREEFGDATISHVTVTVHLRVYTDAERRRNRDA